MPHRDQKNHADRLTRMLREHDMACAACGYNLRGTDGHRCPECGVEPDPAGLLRVGPELGLTWLLRTRVAWAACAATLVATSEFSKGTSRLRDAALVIGGIFLVAWAFECFALDEPSRERPLARLMHHIGDGLSMNNRVSRYAPWIVWSAAGAAVLAALLA